MADSPAAIVRAWHDALNAGDADALVALCAEDVEVGGPRGSDRGSHLMREWAARANVTMQANRLFGRGDTVVAEERAEWHDETGAVTSGADLASVFVVQNGVVASVVRHADLDTALAAAEISSVDEVGA